MSVDRNMQHLHPTIRARVVSVVSILNDEGLPFQVFEGYRSPSRQAYLYSKGRNGNAGSIVTKAKPWQSMHQYGCAADLVLRENGRWSWDDRGQKRKWWKRMHKVAKAEGLEPLSWEMPHLQLPDLSVAKLRRGDYPEDADESWASNLASEIYRSQGDGGAPPVPSLLPERPSLNDNPDEEQMVRSKVIARTGLNLRAGPGVSFPTLTVLQPNLLLYVIGQEGDWSQVDLEGDNLADGYCHSSYLKQV
ncbi:D-alanyl-D-alanine carboxypeptidase family protein [Photobacterium kasasachensis]|uniref:D-alanyl-D-alanine carboxypeptidase family protein n=1 Tax=Photobacterium kasasachensis TaxID=2910240 RepID=UPI003D0A3A6E